MPDVSYSEAFDQGIEGVTKIKDTDSLLAEIKKPVFRKNVEAKVGKPWAGMSRAEREQGSYAQLQKQSLLPTRPWQSGLLGFWQSALYQQYFPEMRDKLYKAGAFEA